ncbi:MAG: histidinol dehydrogenase [Treponema sp.]|nr:histidinol dehydrogenase [Treponema sp.]
MKVIKSEEFDAYWKKEKRKSDDPGTDNKVRNIIEEVRAKGDAAVRKFASKYDKSSPMQLEVPVTEANLALEELRANDPELTQALALAANNIMRFAQKQKEQYVNFEHEMADGVITGQKVIPVQRAAIYIPGGRFPLFSSVLMGMIPAFCAGVEEVLLSSPPAENGKPDKKILAAAAIAAEVSDNKTMRIFSVGGAQAIAAFALGTESIPRADIIAGPGNKYVAAAKRILFGEAGIDFIAGPSDVLIISDPQSSQVDSESNIDGLKENEIGANLVAADMLAQAEHDPDARARALVPNRVFADKINAVIERMILALPTKKIARSSINSGGVIIVYKSKNEAIRIANTIAPEHLELHLTDADSWIPSLKNYGSLFIGQLSAEVFGDYAAGLNHTLPTSGSSKFTGGLSVHNFLKIVTTLNCSPGKGFDKVRGAAEIIGRAEGLEGHVQSAACRR